MLGSVQTKMTFVQQPPFHCQISYHFSLNPMQVQVGDYTSSNAKQQARLQSLAPSCLAMREKYLKFSFSKLSEITFSDIYLFLLLIPCLQMLCGNHDNELTLSGHPHLQGFVKTHHNEKRMNSIFLSIFMLFIAQITHICLTVGWGAKAFLIYL